MNAFQSAAESLSEEEHLQIRKVDREAHFIRLFAFTAGCNWLDVVEVQFRPGSGTCLIREVSAFQRVVCTDFNGVGTRRCVPIREVSSFQRVVCTGFNGVGS